MSGDGQPDDSLECVPVERLAALLQKSETWVYAMARAGKIPHVRVGGGRGGVLFPRRALERWLDGATAEEPRRRGRVDRLAAGR